MRLIFRRAQWSGNYGRYIQLRSSLPSRERPERRLCWIIWTRSLRLLLWGHQISVKRFLRAGESCAKREKHLSQVRTTYTSWGLFSKSSHVFIYYKQIQNYILKKSAGRTPVSTWNRYCSLSLRIYLLFAKVSSRIHGGDQMEIWSCFDQLHVIVVSATLLCQHKRLLCLQNTEHKHSILSVLSIWWIWGSPSCSGWIWL